MKAVHIFFLSLIIALAMPGFSSAMVQEGQQAIDFSLPDVNDGSRNYSLKDFRGKVVLLNIWASWCTGCQAEMPEFIDIQREYAGKGFIIVAVNVDNNREKAAEFIKNLEEKTRKKAGFIIPYDKEKSLAKEYKPRGMPASYLIDKNGKLFRIFLGSFTSANINTLKTAIEGALK